MACPRRFRLQSHSQTQMHLQKSRYSPSPRWLEAELTIPKVLLVPSHPSLSSITPLSSTSTSLTASLNLSCTSFLPTRKRKKKKCLCKKIAEAREGIVFRESVCKDRGAVRGLRACHLVRLLPTPPFFFFAVQSLSCLPLCWCHFDLCLPPSFHLPYSCGPRVMQCPRIVSFRSFEGTAGFFAKAPS